MNSLVKALIQPILEANQGGIALVPGGFKPPTLGHFALVDEVANRPEVSKVIVLIGHKTRDGVTKEESKAIWDIYKKYLPSNVEIQISDNSSPISDVGSIIKNNPENTYYPVVGIRGEMDLGDLKRFDGLKGKYDNFKPIIISSDDGESRVSGTNTRAALIGGEKERFQSYLPTELTDEEKEKVWSILQKTPLDEGTCGYDTDIKTGEKLNTPGGLEEGKQVGVLYHYTSADGLKGILSSNRINTSEEYYLGKELYFISFTRNKNFHKKEMKWQVKTDYRITLDGDKLSDRYRIQPFAYIPGWNYEDNWEYDWLEDEPESVVKDFFNQTGDYDEQEERISFKGPEGSIDNIKNYILAVDKVEDLKEGRKKKSDPKKGTGEKLDTPGGLEEMYAEPSKFSYPPMIKSLTEYMLDKGMNIRPLPKVKFIDDDAENAKNFFGKTAYYDPNNRVIVLYTMGRHPKDIMRSYAHEMIHHMQNCEGRLGNVSTTDINEDDYLYELEKEANLLGTMTFREYTDSLTESIVKDRIVCDNCGWNWPIKDGGDDLYICHKCNHDNTPSLNEETESDILSFPSTFKPGVNITVIFKENKDYETLKPYFEEYGYGFYYPKDKTIFLDGEVFINSDLTFNDLKFVEAHEITHLLLGHTGPYSENDEMDADLGAYILLKKNNLPTKKLESEFKSRHRVDFDEKLLDRVKDML